MKPFLPGATVAILLASVVSISAQQEERQKITEKDKQVFRDFKTGLMKKVEAEEAKARRAEALSNVRQIGLALFEFETEYGFFPNAETAAAVKQATEFQGELKAETANDCFFQLIAAGIVRDVSIFQSGKSAGEPVAGLKPDEVPVRLEKCFFSYIPARNAAGHPERPLVVAPLIKGTALFDRELFAGRAIILRRDNSAVSVPIDEEGRAIINERDLFDPGQPYWKGEEPTVKPPAD